MDEFSITIDFNGKEQSFPAKLMAYGYSIKLEIDIEGTKVFFEPDEERNWRVVLSWEDIQANKKLNPELLSLIADEITAHTK